MNTVNPRNRNMQQASWREERHKITKCKKRITYVLKNLLTENKIIA